MSSFDITVASRKCDVYIILWLIYNLQGALYTSGSLLSQGILAILLVWSLHHYIKVSLFRNTPVLLKALSVMTFMFIVYGVVLIASGEVLVGTEGGRHTVNNLIYLKNILASILPIYTFYLYALRGWLTEEKLKKYVLVFIPVVITQFFHYQHVALMAQALQGGTSGEITNNVGYVVVSILPAVYFFRKKVIWQYIFMGAGIVFIVMAMKRGAILTGAIVMMLFIWNNLRNASRKQKITVLFGAAALLLCGYVVVDYMLENSNYFNARLKATMEARASNREIMYPMIWNAFVNEPNLLIQLFGRGAYGTLKVAPNVAHNDWLEILTCQGLMGITVFIVFWYCFWFTIKYKVHNVYDKMALMMILCIAFMRTLFSMFYSDMTIYFTSVMGFCLARGFERAEEEGISILSKGTQNHNKQDETQVLTSADTNI